MTLRLNSHGSSLRKPIVLHISLSFGCIQLNRKPHLCHCFEFPEKENNNPLHRFKKNGNDILAAAVSGSSSALTWNKCSSLWRGTSFTTSASRSGDSDFRSFRGSNLLERSGDLLFSLS
mmetsp:Transcript_18403/g.50755  ORF Transcript_18403/g.50755 Transcript_18403/m.50755 type:complete len:119 (-) Transcript_18403:300-656(-)